MTTAPLTQEDKNFLKKKINHSNKAGIILNSVSLLACIFWVFGSGYFQPLIIWAGFAFLVTSIWLYTNNTKKKELMQNQKNIYTGTVKKYKEYLESGRDNQREGIIIGKDGIDSTELYCFFTDGDEGEVHISNNHKFLYEKKILKASVKKQESIHEAPRTITKESESTEFLTQEELNALGKTFKKRIKFTLISLLAVSICIFIFLELIMKDVMDYQQLSISRMIFWTSLIIIYAFIYWRGIISVKKDITAKVKTVLLTLIIDKEAVFYKGTREFYLMTLHKKYEIASDGYNLFNTGEEIKIHLTKQRKKLIQIESNSNKDRIYKEPKFFNIKIKRA